MDLTDMIRDATGGFLAGFILGASGICDKCKENIEVLEATLTSEEREKEGLGDAEIEEMRKYERKGNLILPSAVGGIYSALSDIATESTIIESIIVAVPSAYAGRFLGSAVRKLVRKGQRRDLKIAEQIRDDPKNALSYVPKFQREAIESTFGEIERKILDGENLTDEELRGNDELINKMHDVINEQSKIYSPVLLKWSLKNFGKVCRTAQVQREVRKFYEESIPLSLAVLGPPEKTSLMIYEINGQNLSTYRARLDRLTIIEKEGSGTLVKGSVPNITLQDRKVWDRDYKDLARQVIENQPEHTTMLIKTFPGMSDSARVLIVIETFTTAFATYQKRDPIGKPIQPRINPYGFGDSSLN